MTGVNSLSTAAHALDVDLAARLRRLMEILDVILPEAEEHRAAVQRSSGLAFEHIARNNLDPAISLLGKLLKQHPLWLRGYLLLATIYEGTQAIQQAIAVIENGINMCRASVRLLAMPGRSLPMSGTLGHDVRSRNLRRAARGLRYEQILRHRLALLLVRAGRFEEALQCWTELEGLHCA